MSEQGIGRGAPQTQPLSDFLNVFHGGSGGNDYTTYAASSSYTTSAGTGLILENSELALFDLGSNGCTNAGERALPTSTA